MCFGSPNGSQDHQKATAKNTSKHDAQHEHKLVPNGIPNWSQHHKKINLGSTLFQGWLPSGFQSPSRIDFGDVFAPWDNFRQFSDICLVICACILAACCKQTRSKAQGITKRMRQRASKKQLLSSCHLALKSSLANVNELSGPC